MRRFLKTVSRRRAARFRTLAKASCTWSLGVVLMCHRGLQSAQDTTGGNIGIKLWTDPGGTWLSRIIYNPRPGRKLIHTWGLSARPRDTVSNIGFNAYKVSSLLPFFGGGITVGDCLLPDDPRIWCINHSSRQTTGQRFANLP